MDYELKNIDKKNAFPLILASASPRRRELLDLVGVPYEQSPTSVEEVFDPKLSPEKNTVNIAMAKAMDAAGRFPDRMALGADTIVVLDGKIFGKPESEKEAKETLAGLSGRTHEVITGVAIICKNSGVKVVGAETSSVIFRRLTGNDLDNYIATGEFAGKAGGYAIQGLGGSLVESFDGSYTNIVGLPLRLLLRLMEKIGADKFYV